MEEVKGEKQRQLEEMVCLQENNEIQKSTVITFQEEKLKTERTERQSQFDEMVRLTCR